MSAIFSTHRAFEERRGYLDPTTCKGTLEIVGQDEPMLIVKCTGCAFEAGLPAREVNPEVRKRMTLDRAGFPARFSAKRFVEDTDNFFALQAVRNWIAEYKSSSPLPAPALWGDAGVGKSHLLVSLGRRLIDEHGMGVMFRSTGRLLDELQDGLDNLQDGEGYRKLFQRAISVDVLMLDDVGAERTTEWRADRLARLIDERYERELPVVIATNHAPDLWEQALDERSRSRLRGMTFPVELRGRDHRQEELPAPHRGRPQGKVKP